jgi:hypothetical protein
MAEVDKFISGLPTGTIDGLSAVLPLELGMPTGTSTIQASLAQVAQYLGLNGFISENGAQLTYITGTSYKVEAGSAIVDGAMLTWSSPITRTGLTFTSGTMNYVYLYTSGSSTAALEESTTAPAWDTSLQYWAKSGDGTRRCIGFVQALTVNTIRPFVNSVTGRSSDFVYMDGLNPTVVGRRPVNAGTATVWTEFSLAPVVPPHASYALIAPKISQTSAGDEATLAVSPVYMGTTAANFSIFSIRDDTNAAAGAFFVLPQWMPIVIPQTYFYRLLHNIGTTSTALIEVQGARIIR